MNHTLTFWQLLNRQDIIIPLIQRDYAQGRLGKEHIRSAFLKDTEKHLAEGRKLTLDFVYGNAENGKFQPLDGQQRLTTLWLIHWYVAFQLGKLGEVGHFLKKFSYQTRTSSAAFCEALCEKMSDVKLEEKQRLGEYIKKQTWFFSRWMQDPTVSAMLRTLSGDKGCGSEDQIEDVFRYDRLQTYWTNLTQYNIITFNLMIIGTEKLPISDDLYIKMNARGKKLTDFENFKADWVSYIQSIPDLSENKGTDTYAQYYSKQIDNAWTDVFWNSRRNAENFDGNIDSIFFSFINRFVLNQHCLSSVIPATHYNSGKYVATDDKSKAIQKKFDALYGTGLGKKKGSNDDSLVEYKGFDIYRDSLTSHNLKKLDKIFFQLKDHSDCISKLDFSGVDEEDAEVTSGQNRTYHFLPQYIEESGLASTSLKERIYFHTICLFLEDPNWDRLNDWKRIVWNLTENAAIENIEAMINFLRFIDGLGQFLKSKKWEVYENLTEYVPNLSAGTRLDEQWKEEKEKAAKILAVPTMLATIEEAETHAFFKGTIRFLFTNSNGDVDWSNFDTKLESAKKLFSNNEKVSVETIKLFLGMFETFKEDSYFFTTEGYHPRHSSWKKDILCSTALYNQVDALLMGHPSIAKGNYLKFLESGAVEAICKNNRNYNYRYHSSKDIGVHRDYSATEGIYISQERLKRNKIMLALQAEGTITMVQEEQLKNDFLWGKEIVFKYRDKQYCWSLDWNCNNWIRSTANSQIATKWTNEDKDNLSRKLQKLSQ